MSITLYVAGPMTGIEDFNYPAFRAAAELLSAAGYRVLNPVDAEAENDTGKPQAWDWYMRRALRMVTQADAIALLEGWEFSRGAALEVHVGQALLMPCQPVSEWLEARA